MRTRAFAWKRRDRSCQQLRLHAAMLLDWFRVCLRHGWFASLRRRTNHADPATRNPGKRLLKTLKARAKHHLALPYGPKAFDLGIGWHDPPWVTHPKQKS